MIVIRNLDEFPTELRGCAIAIGNFDGVHLGHARLVERLRAMAAAVGGPALVFTFDPPPARILRPQSAPEQLIWPQRKLEILAELGVDATLVFPTDRAFLETKPRDFFETIIRQRLDARAMVEGPNFFFGHNRAGNVEVLRAFCAEAQMPFEAPVPVELNGQMVSSSQIRRLISAGRVEEAAAMLGRPYRLRGTVQRGARRGTQLGFPTANLDQIDTMLPGEGIYAARACINNGWFPAAVSLGANPTFNESGLKVEAHLVGFQSMIYQQSVQLDFIAKLRDIKRFDSVDALTAQMAQDVAQTIEIVS